MRSFRNGLLNLGLAGIALLAAFLAPPVAASAASSGAAAPIVEQAPKPGAPKIKPNATGSPTARLCSAPAVEAGDWVNTDPATTGITRAQLRDCQPVTTCSGDICTITYDAGWIMRLFGKCSPSDCDWGWAPSRFRLPSGQIPATYNQGFAIRYVWAAMSQYRPGQLWIAVRTDFTDPGRADYDSQYWFVRS